MMHYSISIYAKNPAPRSVQPDESLPELGLSTTDKVTFVAWIGEWILRTALSSRWLDRSSCGAAYEAKYVFFSGVT